MDTRRTSQLPACVAATTSRSSIEDQNRLHFLSCHAFWFDFIYLRSNDYGQNQVASPLFRHRDIRRKPYLIP